MADALTTAIYAYATAVWPTKSSSSSGVAARTGRSWQTAERAQANATTPRSRIDAPPTRVPALIVAVVPSQKRR